MGVGHRHRYCRLLLAVGDLQASQTPVRQDALQHVAINQILLLLTRTVTAGSGLH